MPDRKQPMAVGTAGKNRKTLWRIVLAVAIFWLIAGVFLGPSFVQKIGTFWLVDKCLDRGGCWDHLGARCELEDPSKCVRGGPSR